MSPVCVCSRPDRQEDDDGNAYCGLCGELLPDPGNGDLAVLRRSQAVLIRAVGELSKNVAELPARLERVKPSSDAYIDAAEYARRIGKSRDFVYKHKHELGGKPLTNSERSRLVFPWPPVESTPQNGARAE